MIERPRCSNRGAPTLLGGAARWPLATSAQPATPVIGFLIGRSVAEIVGVKNLPNRANTRIQFAGRVISAEVGRPFHAGPSAEMPPGFPCAFGLNQWFEAPNRWSAEATAVQRFKLSDEDVKRVVVRN